MRAVGSNRVRICAVLLACAISPPPPKASARHDGARPGEAGTAEDRAAANRGPVLTIANDKLTLDIRIEGGAMVRLILNDDRGGMNALHAELGHFVCVDGFGPVSPEERTAGLPGHGEAHRVTWETVSSEKSGSSNTVSFSAMLPMAQEIFRRTI